MTRRIYKYPLEITDLQTVPMPMGAHILSVQEQNGRPTIWAIVNPDEKLTSYRSFRIFGTGRPLPDSISEYQFIDTVQTGPLVWHVFEI